MSKANEIIYDQTWHTRYNEPARTAASSYLGFMTENFPISSMLEIGCGHGIWLDVARQSGISDYLGVDGDWTDLTKLKIPRANFLAYDLSKPLDLHRNFSMVLSLEVGEHIPSESSEALVTTIASHGDLVVFGAAIPYQGGFRHINERRQSYWSKLFEVHGFHPFDLLRPRYWDALTIPYYYRQNTLVYVSIRNRELTAIAEKLAMFNAIHFPMLDIVHPEKYEERASYRSIHLRRLVKMLPAAIAAQVRRRIVPDSTE